MGRKGGEGCASLRVGWHWSAFLSIFFKPFQVGSLSQGRLWGCRAGGGGADQMPFESEQSRLECRKKPVWWRQTGGSAFSVSFSDSLFRAGWS